VATHTGMPASAVPPPLPPLPMPLTCVSMSPNRSHGNVSVLGTAAYADWIYTFLCQSLNVAFVFKLCTYK
jgi:hypothetical protein